MLTVTIKFRITCNAQEDEPVVADVVVEVLPVAVGLLGVFCDLDFCQKLFRHFGEVADAIGVTREDDVTAGDDAEQDRHLGFCLETDM